MNRHVPRLTAATTLAALLLVPVSAQASGGSGGGGSGGGGGTSTACAGPTALAVINNTTGSPVAPFWQPNTTYAAQAAGKSDKACDILPVVVRFTDVALSGPASCAAQLATYSNPGYFKYGAKPPSRYVSGFNFSTGSDCLGHAHSLTATMTNGLTGQVYGALTVAWTPA